MGLLARFFLTCANEALVKVIADGLTTHPRLALVCLLNQLFEGMLNVRKDRVMTPGEASLLQRDVAVNKYVVESAFRLRAKRTA